MHASSSLNAPRTLPGEPELLRIPHADVETIQINDGFPCDIGFIVRPNVKISVSTRVGTHMAGPREALTMTGHLFREDGHVRVTFYSCDHGRYTSLTSVDGDPRLELIRIVKDAGGTIAHLKQTLFLSTTSAGLLFVPDIVYF